MREGLQSKRPADIRSMFAGIADRYDLLNRMLSLGRDRVWRREIEGRVAARRPGLVLDACTGTGDVALALGGAHRVVGTDFCVPMLARARTKAAARRRLLPLFAGDVLALPLASASVDVVTVAFGVRNFEDLDVGLGELVRVLRPGGTLLILEFSRPGGVLGPVLRWWVRVIPPRVGRWVSGNADAYTYLPASVRTFPHGESMCRALRSAGLRNLAASRLTCGVATLYEGQKD